MSEEIAYTWHGVWDAGAGGPVEFFGGEDGLPARDLTATDVADFNKVQNAKLNSEAGQRLYKPAKASGGRGKADSDAKPS
jgi:hypothetical protein